MAKIKKTSISGVQISDKDKKLIFAVGIVAVLFLGYNFLISPKYNSVKEVKNNFELVKTKRDKLKSEYENLPALKEKNLQLKHVDTQMKLRVPGFSSLPYSLNILFNSAEGKKVKISAVTVEGTQCMSADEYSMDAPGVTEDKINIPKYVVKQKFSLELSGEFDKLYSFIKDIENCDRKFSIKDVSIKESKVGALYCNMKLETVSFVDKNVIVESPYKMEDFEGRANIFTTTPGIANLPKDTLYYTPEYLMNIKSSTSEGAKVSFMENGKFDTEVYTSAAKEVNGILTINGNANNLTATCRIDNNTKTINSKITLKGNTIRMTVLSSNMANADDKVKLKLNVNNNTKYNFEITVVNDDKLSPKFILANPKDNVIVKGVTR